MVYQGRSAALAPIYLLHRDFTKDEETQEVLAQDATLDVRRFAWSPDGTVGAGLLADVLVSIEPGQDKRQLADGISTVTFGADASTVYAVRVTQDGANDVATVLAINFASEETTELATASYPRPSISEEDALAEAQFGDEGGTVRLYWVDGGTLRLWVLGAGTWEIDPGDGATTELEEDDRPTLWSPEGDRRIRTAFEDGSSTVTLLDDADEEILTITIGGRVSHIRWAPDGERVVFTLGRSAEGGGVLQDLYLWDLNEEDPMRLTATGAAFGAEWRGTQSLWRG
jgi:WD40 repeat protein